MPKELFFARNIEIASVLRSVPICVLDIMAPSLEIYLFQRSSSSSGNAILWASCKEWRNKSP